MAIEKKKIEIIAVTVIFSLLAIVLAYQLWPSGAQKGAKGPERHESPDTYRNQLLKAEMAVKHLPRQREEVETLRRRIDEAVKEIPLESDQTWLSRQINAISARIAVGDVSQRFIPAAGGGDGLAPELKGRFSERTWEIKMQCGYHELGKFMAGIEGSNRFLEITAFSIEGNEPGGQKVVLLVRYLVKKKVDSNAGAPEAKK